MGKGQEKWPVQAKDWTHNRESPDAMLEEGAVLMEAQGWGQLAAPPRCEEELSWPENKKGRTLVTQFWETS